MNLQSSSLLFLVLVACGAPSLPVAPPPASPPLIGTDGIACTGKIDDPPAGLVEVKDDALLSHAVDATGKGKLCAAKTFEAKATVTVYRVWNSAKDYTALGGWWSLSKPKGPVDTYRADNDICPEWSTLDRVSSCTIKIGAHVAMGPGQSADCEKGVAYPKSATNQVFIPNDTRKNEVYVEGCTPGAAWP